jgi:NitT/TauT family transport system permease protein
MIRFRMPDIFVLLSRVLLGAVFLATWQSLIWLHGLDRFFFSSPIDIASRMWTLLWSGQIWPHLFTTLLEASLAFIIGSVGGCAAGFLLGCNQRTSDIVKPYLRIGNAIPRVVLAPLFLLWFGLGIWSKVALGVTVVFFVVFYTTFEGVKNVPVALVNNARMLGASDWQLSRHVLFPSVLSRVFSSMHISVGFSIVAVVVGEYLGASRGIGYLISQSEGVFDTTGVFAGIGILSLVVLVASMSIDRLEMHLLKWKPRFASISTEVK